MYTMLYGIILYTAIIERDMFGYTKYMLIVYNSLITLHLLIIVHIHCMHL